MPQTTIIHIPALDCPDELTLIERSLRKTNGIKSILPDYFARNLRIEHDPADLSAATILTSIQAAGFPAQIALPISNVEPPQSLDERPQRLARRTMVLGGALLCAAVLAQFLTTRNLPVVVLTIASAVVSGIPVAIAARRAIRLRTLDMNVLMIVAAIGAIGIGDYFEAATAMFLFAVSLWLERLSFGRAQRAIHSLVELAPNVAHRMANRGASDEQVTDVDPADLAVGELVLIRPGERIPIDGELIDGESLVNQAPITGESVPVQKQPGDRLFAGTLNGEGSLIFTVSRPAGETTLARIGRLVDQARASRSPTERFIDAFARRYTPAVIALALAIVIIPIVLAQLGVGWAAHVGAVHWLQRGLVLLVIACPCALVISTPITIVSALQQATRLGILVKGGEFLEKAASIRCVALDKTGTITTGAMQVTGIEAFNGKSSDEVLALAAALERHSEHPLATALVSAADQRQLNLPATASITAQRGLGLLGEVNGTRYRLGNPKLFADTPYRLPDAINSGASASTIVWLGSDLRLLGKILLADEPRPGTREAIAQLRALGVEQVVMLTGDNRAAAQAAANAIGIDEVAAELLPQDKIDKVRLLVADGPVAMIGDGVNDAPALAAADLGIALGGQSSDTALETADVVIMTPELAKVAELIQLARRCRRLLKQNIAFALTTKLSVMLLAAFGLATMWLAVASDVGASMLVIANGLRMIRK